MNGNKKKSIFTGRFCCSAVSIVQYIYFLHNRFPTLLNLLTNVHYNTSPQIEIFYTACVAFELLMSKRLKD